MNKRCDNCNFFKEQSGLTMCTNKDHYGYVPSFTSCPDHASTEKLTTPFDGIKFYLVNANTGEIGIKCICEDCGREMKIPYSWRFKLPARYQGQPTLSTSGFHFRCEECTKSRDIK